MGEFLGVNSDIEYLGDNVTSVLIYIVLRFAQIVTTRAIQYPLVPRIFLANRPVFRLPFRS